MTRTNVDALASNDLPEPTDDGRRPAAARLLEGHLVRLGRAGLLVDRRLAPGLLRLRSRRLYRLLGYVRLADYLGERLGMSLRRCQAILRLERMLADLPRLQRALLDGEVSLSKVETIAGAATSATEELWLERARRLTVSGLREAVARAAGADGRDAGGTVSASAHPTETVPASGSSIEQDEPGRLVQFQAPARVLAVWHWTLDLIRRVAGHQEPAWRCVEYLAAEFLSGVPDLSAEVDERAPLRGSAEPAPASAGSEIAGSEVGRPQERPDSAGPVPAPEPEHEAVTEPAPRFVPASGTAATDWAGLAAWSAASSAVREALASIGSAADPEGILSEGSRAAAFDEGASGDMTDKAGPGDDEEIDAWALDARLRRLVRLRQSLAWRQGRLLATLASLRLHRELGFATFDDFVTERVAMSPRRARYLMSLDRRLRPLPLLADAYRRGLVSWCQARLLVRVVEPPTQSRWIRYAREVTVRRLEDVVVACEVAAAESAPAHIGASATDSPAPVGALAVTSPAHIGAPPLPPADPSPGQVVAGFTTASAQPAAAGAAAPISTTKEEGAAPDTSSLHTSASVGHPSGKRRIVFWAPLDVAALWDSALRACRAAAGRHLDDWECFLIFVQAVRETWENPDDPHWRRRYRIFERDGWRCMAPGCTSRSGLNEHHIVFRSLQGGDEQENLVTLCIGHHQQGVHEGRIGCFGRAPGALWWELGVRPDGPPLVRYFGERVVRHRPYVPMPADARAAHAAGGGAAAREGAG